MATAHRSSDLGAALTGLIVGAVVLFIIVFGIVKLTNASYAGEEHGAAAAAHAPAAAHGPDSANAAPASGTAAATPGGSGTPAPAAPATGGH